MTRLLTLAVAIVTSLAATAGAVPYHFSGAACQPETFADANHTLTNGGGISNSNGAPFAPVITVVCPVVGLESTTQTQTELRARLFDGNPHSIGGFWQVDSIGLGTIWWSSIKYACSAANGCTSPPGTFTGAATVRWLGSELIAGTFGTFSTYSFRSLIPGRCNDSSCGSPSWVQSYGVTHNER